MTEKKPTSKAAKPKEPTCDKCNDLEARIAALELARRAFDKWTTAFGHYPLSIFEEQVKAEDADA